MLNFFDYEIGNYYAKFIDSNTITVVTPENVTIYYLTKPLMAVKDDDISDTQIASIISASFSGCIWQVPDYTPIITSITNFTSTEFNVKIDFFIFSDLLISGKYDLFILTNSG